MSLAHFDEVYEICCEFMVLDEMARKEKGKNGGFEVSNNRRPVGYEWWELAIEEIENERKILNV